MNDQLEPSKNAFLPIVLIAVSLLIVWGRDLTIVRQQKTAIKQVIEQQVVPALAQSREAGAKFEKMVRELLQLAQTDDEARAIVVKYGISVNNTAPAK